MSNVRLNELLDYVRQGRILDAMTEFYADGVVMEEPLYGTTEGLDANIKREEAFVSSVKEFRSFEVVNQAESDNTAFYENKMSWLGQDGNEYNIEQVSVQTWEGGKIVRERFYYKG